MITLGYVLHEEEGKSLEAPLDMGTIQLETVRLNVWQGMVRKKFGQGRQEGPLDAAQVVEFEKCDFSMKESGDER